jgi:hypothetical protein
MNIFVVDHDPQIAARMLCNKHILKMIVETAQLLTTAFPPGATRYKHTHVNHPCAKWVRASLSNYGWLMRHACELCNEYTRRYGKVHKTEEVIASLEEAPALDDVGLMPFVQAMPDKYKGPSAVAAYRAYYVGDKARFAKWAPRSTPPTWWPYDEAP